MNRQAIKKIFAAFVVFAVQQPAGLSLPGHSKFSP
jgi:hypothetical protein